MKYEHCNTSAPTSSVQQGNPRSTEAIIIEADDPVYGDEQADTVTPINRPQSVKDQRIDELNKRHAVVMNGGNAYILDESYDPELKRDSVSLWSLNGFKAWYANQYLPPATKEGQPRKLANAYLTSKRRRQYEGMVFMPQGGPDTHLNLWRGMSVEPKQGSCERWKEHLAEVICDNDKAKFDYLWRWFAHMVQRPSELPRTAIVMRSGQGTGKNTIIEPFARIFSAHYLMVTNLDHLCGRFNAHLSSLILVFANEAIWGGDKQGEGTLKALITDPDTAVEYKGKDVIRVGNYKRLIIASNEEWCAPRDHDDRRYFCLDVSHSRVGDTAYFNALYEEINNGGTEALLHELLQTDISNWNPLGDMPKTRDGEDLKIRSLSSPLKFWHECLERGRNVPVNGYGTEDIDTPRWETEISKNGIYSMYVDWCHKHGVRHPDAPNAFSRQLRKAIQITDYRPSNGDRTRYFRLPEHEEACRQFQARIADIDFDYDA